MERLEVRFQILLLKGKVLKQIDNEMENVVDAKNLGEELEGAYFYEVFISCMKTKFIRFQRRTQLAKDI